MHLCNRLAVRVLGLRPSLLLPLCLLACLLASLPLPLCVTGRPLLLLAPPSLALFLLFTSRCLALPFPPPPYTPMAFLAGYARDHEPCVIFMDEIDAIGGKRFSEGTSADREIQRTLMELLNQMDGFEALGSVKVVMATNRPDILDPALMRPVGGFMHRGCVLCTAFKTPHALHTTRSIDLVNLCLELSHHSLRHVVLSGSSGSQD